MWIVNNIKIEIYNLKGDFESNRARKRDNYGSSPCASFSSANDEETVLELILDFPCLCVLTQKRLVKEERLDHSTYECDHGKSSMNNFLFLAPQLIFGRQIGQDI